MSKKAESPVHIEWSLDWVRASNSATGQTAEAASIAGLGSILSGTREALVGVGRKHVFLKTIRLPKAAPDDLRRILGVQLGQIFPLPLDQLAFDFIQTSDMDAEGCLTLVAAMRSDDLRRLRSDLAQSGLTATRILPIALASAAVAQRSGHANALVVDPDLGGLAFDVVEGGIVRLSRVTAVDSDVEIEGQRTLAAAKSTELPRVFGGDLDKSGRPAGRLTLAQLHEAPPFNFVLTEDRENAIKRETSNRTRLGGLLVLAALMLFVLVLVDRLNAQKNVQQVQASWSRQLVKLNARKTDASNAAEAATGLGTALHTAFESPQPLSDIIAVIGDSLPPGAWLNQISVERGKPADIRGTAQTSEQVDKFVRKLGGSPRFRDVRLVFANSATVGKVPVVQFNVSAVCVGNLPMPAPPQVTGMRSAPSSTTSTVTQ